jgi:TusA-related sulfurtransferase
METVDARGLSCPQPVLLTLSAIKQGKSDELQVLVDNATSKENVIRAATGSGWKLNTTRQISDQEFHLEFKRSGS